MFRLLVHNTFMQMCPKLSMNASGKLHCMLTVPGTAQGKHCICLLPHPASFLAENPLCLWRTLCSTKGLLQDHYILYCLCNVARASVEANLHSLFSPKARAQPTPFSPCSVFIFDHPIGELISSRCN